MSCITRSALLAALFGTLAIPGPLAAAHAQAAPRYTVVDIGSLGGPNSSISGPNVKVLTDSGLLGAVLDTSTVDSDAQVANPTLGLPDNHVQHAVLWTGGARIDLGALPGQNTSDVNWVNDRGDVVGQSENGTIDPFTGLAAVSAVLWTHGSMTNLGTLPGGYESLPTALNEAGLVVGFSTNGIPDPSCSLAGCWGAQTRAVEWRGGIIHDLGTLGGRGAVANFVNNRGQISGASFTNNVPNSGTGQPTQDPFLWQDGTMADLGTLGGTLGFPLSMNNRGEVVGQSNVAGDQTAHPFLWNGSRLLDLGTLGGPNGMANWINDAGQVVGIADLTDGRHMGFLWQSGTMTPLKPVPGAPCSNAYAINNEGQAVGNATDCHGHVQTTVLWDRGTPIGLQSLVGPTNLHMTEAWNINDRGEVAGVASLPDGTEHAVLLIPSA